ncbi:MAG: hypothetical protein HYV24_07040 [Deltaproteobacteria bacterium]|nr:hypothetical protein [Deltaproteobacteria bacterium]
MCIREELKARQMEAYRKMSRGKKIELAIELSEFVLGLKRGMKRMEKEFKELVSVLREAKRKRFSETP